MVCYACACASMLVEKERCCGSLQAWVLLQLLLFDSLMGQDPSRKSASTLHTHSLLQAVEVIGRPLLRKFPPPRKIKRAWPQPGVKVSPPHMQPWHQKALPCLFCSTCLIKTSSPLPHCPLPPLRMQMPSSWALHIVPPPHPHSERDSLTIVAARLTTFPSVRSHTLAGSLPGHDSCCPGTQ